MRAERGAGFANGDGGIVTRGDSGRTRVPFEPLPEEAVVLVDDPVAEKVLDSYEVFRDNAG